MASYRGSCGCGERRRAPSDQRNRRGHPATSWSDDWCTATGGVASSVEHQRLATDLLGKAGRAQGSRCRWAWAHDGTAPRRDRPNGDPPTECHRREARQTAQGRRETIVHSRRARGEQREAVARCGKPQLLRRLRDARPPHVHSYATLNSNPTSSSRPQAGPPLTRLSLASDRIRHAARGAALRLDSVRA